MTYFAKHLHQRDINDRVKNVWSNKYKDMLSQYFPSRYGYTLYCAIHDMAYIDKKLWMMKYQATIGENTQSVISVHIMNSYRYDDPRIREVANEIMMKELEYEAPPYSAQAEMVYGINIIGGMCALYACKRKYKTNNLSIYMGSTSIFQWEIDITTEEGMKEIHKFMSDVRNKYKS